MPAIWCPTQTSAAVIDQHGERERHVEEEVVDQHDGGEHHRRGDRHAAGLEADPGERDEERQHDRRHADEVRGLVARVLVVGRVETHLLFDGFHKPTIIQCFNRVHGRYARLFAARPGPVCADDRQLRRRAPRPPRAHRSRGRQGARNRPHLLRPDFRAASARILRRRSRAGAHHAAARQARAARRRPASSACTSRASTRASPRWRPSASSKTSWSTGWACAGSPVGRDFRYGARRAGDFATLEAAAQRHGFSARGDGRRRVRRPARVQLRSACGAQGGRSARRRAAARPSLHHQRPGRARRKARPRPGLSDRQHRAAATAADCGHLCGRGRPLRPAGSRAWAGDRR